MEKKIKRIDDPYKSIVEFILATFITYGSIATKGFVKLARGKFTSEKGMG
jgi:hypothetical protein